MDYLQLTAPCGRDCFNCPLFLANENNTLRKALAEKYQQPEDRISCKGCREARGCIYFLHTLGISHSSCNIFQCAEKKNINFCYECNDFPCDNLHPYIDKAEFPHNLKVFNLCLIKKIGLEEWARNKAHKVWDTYINGTLTL
jgi:hypothetical protein